MHRVPPEAILSYLRVLDKQLSGPAKLVIIGGFAIALGWDEW